MSVMEIALLVVGVIIFVISFLLPEKEEQKSEKDLSAEKEEVHRLLEQEIDGMKLKVNEATNDTVEYAVDRAERSLEKVSNEKIMAVNEYAGTIIEEINRNHKEVMFLYDMLRDKQADLTNAVRKADATVKEIENVSHSAQAASETLLRGMSVATVSQKGLTAEQKSVFDDIQIPDAEPVVYKSAGSINQSQTQVAGMTAVSEERVEAPNKKSKAAALAQSKIFASLSEGAFGDNVSNESKNDQAAEVISQGISTQDEYQEQSQEMVKAPTREKVAYDILSGMAFKDGAIVNVDSPAAGAVTAADYAAMVANSSQNQGPVSQAPANNNDQIIALSKQGLSTVEIAKTLSLGVGEVKLVLDLFR